MEEYLVSNKPFLDGFQKLYKFPNGYGASVVKHKGSYGLELAVIKWDGEIYSLCYDTPIADDVLGFLDDEKVNKLLKNICNFKNRINYFKPVDYESPIKIFEKVASEEITRDLDGYIWHRIKEIDVSIDKDRLLDLLKRDKPIKLIKEDSLLKCPNCGEVYVAFLDNFCGNCGQRILKR